MDLKKENKILKKRLKEAELFIKREVEVHKNIIASQKIASQTDKKTRDFFNDFDTEIIEQYLEKYFGAELVAVLDDEIIENIISAELVYFHLLEVKEFDGFAVISGYTKALDVFIETYITKPFRKFAGKEHQRLPKNTLVEKNLYRVIYKGHSLSLGRLYQVLLEVRDASTYTFLHTFQRFLLSYKYIEKVLYNFTFLEQFNTIMKLEILSEKRHKGIVTYEELQEARDIIFGDFKDKESFSYRLFSIARL